MSVFTLRFNYIEEEFTKKSYFLDETVFDSDYIPKNLLHRENELIILSRIFLPLIKQPNSTSRKLIVTGNIGVGKTVTLHKFSDMLKESSKLRGINFEVVHINCRSHRTSYLILTKIVKSLIKDIPERGLSPSELLNSLMEVLKKTNTHLLLILDEMSIILNNDVDILYTLSRVNESNISKRKYLSLICVVKDVHMLKSLDDATLSTLQNEIIHFKNYTKQQIFDIIIDRIKLGVRPNIISKDIIEMIARMTARTGDMRMALKLIKNSVLYAERHDLNSVSPEAVRVANAEFSPLSRDDLNRLNLHELLIFKAICNVLQTQNKRYIPIKIIAEEYKILSENLGEQPRSNTQIWEYIQNLKNLELISVKILNKNIKGRKSMVSVQNYSIKTIQGELKRIIKERS
ncbi:MAG: AAA family ATPase [Candidatus Lokiarchaeota archaeon]|nr:AAA family ATPase [Candidatus Lokiarchaeota archaeon]